MYTNWDGIKSICVNFSLYCMQGITNQIVVRSLATSFPGSSPVFGSHNVIGGSLGMKLFSFGWKHTSEETGATEYRCTVVSNKYFNKSPCIAKDRRLKKQPWSLYNHNYFSDKTTWPSAEELTYTVKEPIIITTTLICSFGDTFTNIPTLTNLVVRRY